MFKGPPDDDEDDDSTRAHERTRERRKRKERRERRERSTKAQPPKKTGVEPQKIRCCNLRIMRVVPRSDSSLTHVMRFRDTLTRISNL